MDRDRNRGISFTDFALMDNGNPYVYNLDDVVRFYVNNMGDRVRDWFRNYQAQRALDNANRQQLQVPQQDYSWMQGLGY